MGEDSSHGSRGYVQSPSKDLHWFSSSFSHWYSSFAWWGFSPCLLSPYLLDLLGIGTSLFLHFCGTFLGGLGYFFSWWQHEGQLSFLSH